jgi:hypothetical protein
MHYICEIIMPPTKDVEKTVSAILKPFNEHKRGRHVFWDWYVIGGRFAGQKFLASFDKERLDKFYKWCDAEKVTVGGLQCGKQELKPDTQIPKVDAQWNELFPENKDKPCPIFAHSNNQYDSKDTIQGDICFIKEIPQSYKAERLIIAAPSWTSKTKERTGALEAVFMLSTDFYNGVNYINSNWCGNVLKGLKMFQKRLKTYSDSYREVCKPKEDWLSVTVDYHS